MIDFSKISTEQLVTHYRFHVQDNGTRSLDEEMRRCYLIQELGDELVRRGRSLDIVQASSHHAGLVPRPGRAPN